jgi:O-antigen ligase
MPLTRKQIHEQVYYYALILIAICLPLSVFTTSVFQLLLLANWLVEGRFREKWRMALSNRALQLFLLIFGLHLLGLLWSEYLAYGL